MASAGRQRLDQLGLGLGLGDLLVDLRGHDVLGDRLGGRLDGLPRRSSASSASISASIVPRRSPRRCSVFERLELGFGDRPVSATSASPASSASTSSPSRPASTISSSSSAATAALDHGLGQDLDGLDHLFGHLLGDPSASSASISASIRRRRRSAVVDLSSVNGSSGSASSFVGVSAVVGRGRCRSSAGLGVEELQDQLAEHVVDPDDEGGEHDQRHQDDDRVVDGLGAGWARPPCAARRDLTEELPGGGALGLGSGRRSLAALAGRALADGLAVAQRRRRCAAAFASVLGSSP